LPGELNLHDTKVWKERLAFLTSLDFGLSSLATRNAILTSQVAAPMLRRPPPNVQTRNLRTCSNPTHPTDPQCTNNSFHDANRGPGVRQRSLSNTTLGKAPRIACKAPRVPRVATLQLRNDSLPCFVRDRILQPLAEIRFPTDIVMFQRRYIPHVQQTTERDKRVNFETTKLTSKT
jgi:hypothetical protein